MKAIAAALLGAMLFTGCGRSNAVVVGSKNFVEQLLLGELAAQQLERKHIQVERKFNLGGTLLAQGAIVKGDIDMYPEYTGTALNVVLGEQKSGSETETYETVRNGYEQRFHLRWLDPLGFNDTFAMVVRSEDAARLKESTLTGAAKAREWRLGVGYEFLTRTDGLRKLDATYDLRWKDTPETMDLGLLYRALEQKQIDMAAANSTDAQLGQGKFRALRDDRNTFPPYNACFVVREELLARRPEIASALGLLKNRVSDEAMQRMNRRVVIGHDPVEKVIKDFLETLETAP